MTYEEAREIIVGSRIYFGRTNGKTIFCEALEKSKTSLEKQIPKKVKVKIKEDEQNRKYHHCPVCDRWITSMANYCSDCGQALDWGE